MKHFLQKLLHIFVCSFEVRGWTAFGNPVSQCAVCGDWTVSYGAVANYEHRISKEQAYDIITEWNEKDKPPFSEWQAAVERARSARDWALLNALVEDGPCVNVRYNEICKEKKQ